MSNMQIISKQDANRERFRNYRFEVKSLGEFMSYIFTLIERLFKFEIISKDEKASKSTVILKAFHDRAKGNEIIMANLFYIFSYWLRSMENDSALEKVEQITSVDIANDSINEALEFLQKKIMRSDILLKSVQKKILKMNSKNLKLAYSELESALNNMKEYLCSLRKMDEIANMVKFCSNVNFKSMHVQKCLMANYNLLVETCEECYFKTLEGMIQNFCVEISILGKLQAKDVVNALENVEAKVNHKRFTAGEDIEKYYSDQLKELKKDYERQMAKFELQELEIEKNTDGNISTLDEDSVLDNVQIKQQYLEEKAQLEEEWKKAMDKLETDMLEADDVILPEEWLANQSYSVLSYMLKNIAYRLMLRNGVEENSQSDAEKMQKLDNMDIKVAITEVLKYSVELGLSEGEYNYLCSIK